MAMTTSVGRESRAMNNPRSTPYGPIGAPQGQVFGVNRALYGASGLMSYQTQPGLGQQATAARYGATGLRGPVSALGYGGGFGGAPEGPGLTLLQNEATLRALSRNQTGRGMELRQQFARQDAREKAIQFAQRTQALSEIDRQYQAAAGQAAASGNFDRLMKLTQMRERYIRQLQASWRSRTTDPFGLITAGTIPNRSF